MKRDLFLYFALAILITLLVSCSRTASPVRIVNFYVWSNYIPDSVLHDFEKDTGIRINYDTYDSNEALLEKMQSGLADYDVIVPSDYMVGILVRQKLLQKLDRNRIPNSNNIGARFMNPLYDRGNVYSVPFLWATTGIGYDKSKITETVESWSILWDPKYAGRILMLDDMRECFGVALKWKGHSLNSTDPSDLAEAKQLLLQQKPLLKGYNSTSFDDMLLAGDTWMTHSWSGQIALVAEDNHNLSYALPKEGGPIAVENFAIPETAKHREEAHILINYLLDARVGAKITNLSHYPNTNEAAKKFIKPEILHNPVIYPDETTLARCELISDIGPAYKVMDRYWTEIKSQ
jgi:spermidine/putrescine-binding protein